MAFPGSATALNAENNQNNLTSYTSVGSFAAPNGELVIAAAYAFGNASVQPTVSHAGVSSWTIRQTVTAGSGARTLHVFTGVGDGSSGTITFDYGSQQLTDAAWAVISVSEVDQATNDGVVQAPKMEEADTSAPSVTLAAFASSDNATIGIFGSNNTDVSSAGSGFTLVNDSFDGSGKVVFTEFQAGADTTADATLAASDFTMGVALELAEVSGGLTAAVISEGEGTSDTQAVVTVDSYDAAASSHDLHRSTTQGFTPGAGNLLAADIDPDVDYVDDTVAADTQYFYRLLSYE